MPMEKNGKKVLDLVMSQKGITYDGNIQDWITVKVYMVDMSKTLGLLILKHHWDYCTNAYLRCQGLFYKFIKGLQNFKT